MLGYILFIDSSTNVLLYFVLLIVFMLISWITNWRARKSWSCNTELRGEINNDELALISGGWTRVAHLMVLRLLDNECVGLKKSLTGKLSLVYRKACERNLSMLSLIHI